MGTDIHGLFQKQEGEKWVDVPSKYDEDRHYLLFAWLAGVRNGFGFAGVPTHTPVKPIAEGRGLPDDFVCDGEYHPVKDLSVMSPSDQKYHNDDDDPLEIWMGDHSHSWVLDDEILTAPLPTVTKTGVITLAQFKSWDGKTQPDAWCGGITGPDILVSFPDTITEHTTHVQIVWSKSLKDEFNYFIDEVRRLKQEHGKVRFVFGFDS